MMSLAISLFLIVGALLSLVSAVGIHRLKDPYTRLHATSTINSLGLVCLLLASSLYFMGESTSHSLRQLLTILFLFSTVPAGVHILSRAAIVRGVGLWKVHGKVSDAEREIMITIQEQSEKRRAMRVSHYGQHR